MNPPLLSVQDLSIRFGQLQVVDQLSFSLQRGEALGLVGESGCGKSVTSLALMGLLQGAQVEGSIRLDDRPLLGLSQRTWQEIRGRRISMVFQDPMTTLNPLMTVGAHLAEALQTLQGLPRSACRTRAAEWLELVGIPDPVRRLEAHPHELSGGMRQRVSIALALCG
ncbi:MAG TPA: ATP-binding cassette domain-containing protein, partial [Myxococcota bacterium]|nr:ATP-binding cassette domain-containing protein [Myxococcota bacterium]